MCGISYKKFYGAVINHTREFDALTEKHTLQPQAS